MKVFKFRGLLLGGCCVSMFILAACGGGGGGSSASNTTPPPPASPQTVVTGIAATGKPISGATVTVKDMAGNSATATTGNDGTFKVTSVTRFTPPFLVQVGMGAGGDLYSVSADANTTTTINVTPLTDVIVRAWYGVQGTPVSADTAFGNPGSNTPPSPGAVQSLATVVQNVVQSFLTNAGVPASFNLVTSTFTADGTGFDKVLDQVGATTVGSNGTTVSLKATNGTITQDTTLTLTLGTVAVATTTTGGANGASSSSATSVAIPVTSAEQTAQAAIVTLLGNFANAINTKGASLAVSDLQPYTDPGLLNDGLSQSQFLANIVSEFGGSSGRTVSLTLVQLKALDTTNNAADALVQVSTTSGSQTRNETGEFFFKEVSGAWLFSGNQRIASIDLAAQYLTAVMPTCPNTCPIEPAQGLVVSGNVDAPNLAGGALQLASPPTVSGGAGGLLNNVAFMDGGQDTGKSPAQELYYFVYPPSSASAALNPSMLPAGTPFTITLTPASGAPVSYTVPLNSWTTDPVVLTAPTSTALAAANLGGSLTVSWTLPTTYAIAQVKLSADGQETTNGSGPQCTFGQSTRNWPVLANTAATATISLPTTCPDGNPIVTVNINVTTVGVNGEQSAAQILMQ